MHELAPQYRQFFHIFEAFKIADQKLDIPPPMLAMPTSLTSKAPMMVMGDQFQEENEEADEVYFCFTAPNISLSLFLFIEKTGRQKQII